MKAMKLEVNNQISCVLKQSRRELRLPHCQSSNFLRKLVNILLRSFIALIQPPLKQMRQFIELAKLPAGVRVVLPAADRGGVLVVFLKDSIVSMAVSRGWYEENEPRSTGRRST